MINVKNTKKIRRTSNFLSQRKVDRRSQRKVDRRSQRKVDRRSQRKVDRRSQRKRKRINRTIKKNRNIEENMIRIINGGAPTAFLDAVRETHIEDHENIINKILSLSGLTNDKDKEIFGKLFSVIPIEEDGNVKFYVKIISNEIDENAEYIKRLIQNKTITDAELIYDNDHFSTDFTKLKEDEAYIGKFLDGIYIIPLTFIVNLLKVIGNDLFKLYKEELLGAEMNVLVAEEEDEEGDDADPSAAPSVAFGNPVPTPVVSPQAFPAAPSVPSNDVGIKPKSLGFNQEKPLNSFTKYLINYIRFVSKTIIFKRLVTNVGGPKTIIPEEIINDDNFVNFTNLIINIPKYLKNVIISIKEYIPSDNKFIIESEKIIDNILNSQKQFFKSENPPNENKWFFITILGEDNNLHQNISAYLEKYCNTRVYNNTIPCDKVSQAFISGLSYDVTENINNTIKQNNNFQELGKEVTLSNPTEMLEKIHSINKKQYGNAWGKK